MLQLKPLDQNVPIFQQINSEVSPVVLVNVFQVAEGDIPALLRAWEADANWMNSSQATSQLSCIKALLEAPSS